LEKYSAMAYVKLKIHITVQNGENVKNDRKIVKNWIGFSKMFFSSDIELYKILFSKMLIHYVIMSIYC